jgi:hemerythrin superfamily protein
MDIYQLLQQDHARISDLLAKLSETERPMRERRQLFNHVRHELMMHMVAEEKIFYSLLVEEDIAEDLALEAAEEHHLVKLLLEELAGHQDAAQWAARLQVLTELVAHHVEEEEKQLFPKVKGVLDREQAEELAIQVEEEKASYGEPEAAPRS